MMFYLYVNMPNTNNAIPVLVDDDLYAACHQSTSYSNENYSTMREAVEGSASIAASNSILFDALKYVLFHVPVLTGPGATAEARAKMETAFNIVFYDAEESGSVSVDGWIVPAQIISNVAGRSTLDVSSVNNGYISPSRGWFPYYTAYAVPNYTVSEFSYRREEYSVIISVLPTAVLSDGGLDLSKLSDFVSDAKYTGVFEVDYNRFDQGHGDWSYTVHIGHNLIAKSQITDNVNEAISDATNISDPFAPAGPSASGTYPGQIVDGEPIGGDGTFDFDSDLIPDSSTPTNPFAGGMITGYMLTDAQMQQLAQFLWASPWDWLAQWRKLWGDPMNAIIGCFKVNLPAYSGSSATVKLGNIDTGISALAVSGIATVNCGSVFIDKKYGSYLDYSPYTSLELYLPYIGTVGLNVDEVMGKYITVSYNVCLLDGSATCTVFVGDGTNLSVLHQYSCMVGMNVPITSAQYDGMQRSLTNVIGAVTDNIVPAITTIAGVAAGLLNPAIAAGALGGMASNIMGAEENNPVTLNKPNIRHSGGISMASGLMGRQRPYIIRHTPRMAFPEGQNTYIGYPNWTGMSLGSLSGFTRVHKIHLSCSGTEEEKAEIVRLLMEGVIL